MSNSRIDNYLQARQRCWDAFHEINNMAYQLEHIADRLFHSPETIAIANLEGYEPSNSPDPKRPPLDYKEWPEKSQVVGAILHYRAALVVENQARERLTEDEKAEMPRNLSSE